MIAHSEPQLHDDIHRELMSWCVICLSLLGFLLMVVQLDQAPLLPFMLGMILIVLIQISWSLRDHHHMLATTIMVFVQIATLTILWQTYPGTPLRLFLVVPIITSGLAAGPWAAAGSTLAATGVLILGRWQWSTMAVREAFPSDLVLLWTVGGLVLAAQRVQWRVTSAAWNQYVGARDNLRLALDRQVELKQVLADLEHANQQTVRLNEMLSAARTAVEDARRAKEEFVANVSHELRTPLNMIIGFSDMILESPDTYAERLPPALLADIAAIRRNSEHLSGLVDDVLALAEADVGQMKLLMEPTALHSIAQEAAEAVRVLIRQKGLKMHLDVPTSLPLVHCDRTRIRQVILNLLGNAARFTEEGYVAVRAWVKGGNVVVEVEDTGPGIDASRLARIFEPFWQGDPAIRRRYGGTGLGLAISKRFVEAHGGTIGIRSAPEQGTTVIFTMPIEQPVAVDPAQRWLSPHGEYVQRQGPSRVPHQIETTPTLVVAERHPTLSHLLARHLSDMRIVSVDSLVEAGQVLDARGAVGVVMNRFQQPDESPLHLTELRATFDVPVLSCSLPSRDLAVQRLGVNDYMLKPIQHEQLRATLRTHAPDARTILVADDDDEARQLFVRMLLHLDPSYVVLDAEDGWETLELMESRRPDVVLLDLIMPGMDGFQVLEQRERHAELAKIPVIVISARDLEEDRILRDGLTVTRRDGLSGRDLAAAVSAVTQALTPQFAAPEQPGTPDGS